MFYTKNFEIYLLETVGDRFRKERHLTAFDFFCIVSWKANRAKSKMAKRLLKIGKKKGCDSLEATVKCLTGGLADKASREDRLRWLWMDWKIRLPMASAILSILFPKEFTIYDYRVCKSLDDRGKDFLSLGNRGPPGNFKRLWDDYESYLREVKAFKYPSELLIRDDDLREMDRFLWGKSFYDQLQTEVKEEFRKSITKAEV